MTRTTKPKGATATSARSSGRYQGDPGEHRRLAKAQPTGPARTPKPEQLLLPLAEAADTASPVRTVSLAEERVSLEASADDSLKATVPIAIKSAGKLSDSEKLAIFKSLFRGREDVFALRWENGDKGTSGYAPACANKFVSGLCDMKKAPCRICRNRKERPVTDDILLAHLKGHQVVGVYPLLTDDTCWFLAIDFDEDQWQRDIEAVRQTSGALGIPGYVERSRSGKGGHLWFFFTEPIPAADARRLGTHVLTETMGRYPQLSFSSYDRLFPNQDTMPRGGLGNLIALPLQGKSRAQGNACFVDERFAAYDGDGQWLHLLSAERMTRARVAEILRHIGPGDSAIGGPTAAIDREPDLPGKGSPTGKRGNTKLAGPLPSRIEATLSQRLFVARSDLPPALINRIRRLAAFQNPEFYRRQATRQPIYRTPRIIYLAEDLEDHVSLPRGSCTRLAELADELGVHLEIKDERNTGSPVAARFCGSLTDIQSQAVEALQSHDFGIVVAPPGAGKTVVGAAMIARRGCNTLVLVHRCTLLDQWRSRLAQFLGMPQSEIGAIQGKQKGATSKIDVATVQSLLRDGDVMDLVAHYGHVVVDECHHVPAFTVERILSQAKARYVLGLTATPHRRDGHEPIMRMQLGPVRFTVENRAANATHPFRHVLIVRDTEFEAPEGFAELHSAGVQETLSRDDARNNLILDDIIATIHEGRSPMVLVERREHVAYLAERLSRHARNLFVLTGGQSDKQRRELTRQMDAISPNEPRVVVATGKFVGEGFDDPRLDTLFLASPISWKATVAQYVGRLHRLHAEKREVRVFDYVDGSVPRLKRMFELRLKSYRSLGYEIGDLPDEFWLCAEPDHCPDDPVDVDDD